MCKKIVRDKIYESVNCNAQPDGKRNRIAERFFRKNHQKNRSERKDYGKNIVRLKATFSRNVMSFVDFPKYAVKQPTMNGVRQNLHPDKAKNY